MKISTKGKYGLKAVVDIAMFAEDEKCVSIKAIAERQGLSENYLEQIIGSLRKAGVVQSKRGANGGYFITKPSCELTVGEVLRVLEGPLTPSDCIVSRTDSCGRSDCNICHTKDVWQILYDKINEVVDSISIEDLIKGSSHSAFK